MNILSTIAIFFILVGNLCAISSNISQQNENVSRMLNMPIKEPVSLRPPYIATAISAASGAVAVVLIGALLYHYETDYKKFLNTIFAPTREFHNETVTYTILAISCAIISIISGIYANRKAKSLSKKILQRLTQV